VLRQIVGEDMLTAEGDTIELASDAIELDVDEFERTVASGDVARASDMVTGDFLEGFAIGDASEFEDWLMLERSRLREIVMDYALRSSIREVWYFVTNDTVRRAIERATKNDDDFRIFMYRLGEESSDEAH